MKQRWLLCIAGAGPLIAYGYRRTLPLRLRVARRRKAAGWGSYRNDELWGPGSRVVYIQQDDARLMVWAMLFPPIMLGLIPKLWWWGLLSVPESLLEQPFVHGQQQERKRKNEVCRSRRFSTPWW